jgi:hypothetical protein
MSPAFTPWRALSRIPVDVPSVSDCHDEDEEDIVFDRVDDPVVADADAMQVLRTGQLGRAGWAWIGAERGDPAQYPLLKLWSKTPDLPLCVFGDVNAIWHRFHSQTEFGL